MIELFRNWDQSLEQYIYLHRFKGADNFLAWATENATFISFALLFLLVIAYFFNKKQIYLYAALNAAVINGITALITGAIKISIERPRPYEVNDLIQTPLINSGGFSFPSGHTTEVFALLFTVWFLLRNKFWTAVFLIWALLIAYSRMAFGVHYPVDILGGIIVSGITAYIWMKYEPLKRWFKQLNA